MKDWMGNGNSVYKTLGASNHTDKERENHDYYATDPKAIDALVKRFGNNLSKKVWEPACGEGHLSKRLTELGYDVYSSDKINRGFGDVLDFFSVGEIPCECIITNPPYKYALEFIKHSLELLSFGGYCIMLLKTTFLEGMKRYTELFSVTPPMLLLQFSKRVLCAKNGEFQKMIDGGGSAVSYGWFVWQKGYKGKTQIDWLV